MIIKTDEYGNVTGAVGSMGELKTMKAWLFCQLELVYGKKKGVVIAESIPMNEALQIWNKTVVAVA